MYIEDILGILAIRVPMNPFDSKLISSFYDQTAKGLGLTEKQSVIALKIISKYVTKISVVAGTDLTASVSIPTYKLGIRTITTIKSISIIPNLEYKKAIKVQFPFDEQLLASIKKEKSKLGDAAWNSDLKSWIFPLTDAAIQFLSPWVENNNFNADSEFLEYVMQATVVNSNIESHIPMLTYDGETTKLVNVHSTVPQLTSNDILKSLFEARRAGITTWDSNVGQCIDELNINPVTKNFLNSEMGAVFSINLEETNILSLTDIVENSGPCVIIVPGGNELNKLKIALEILNSANIKNEEISVLFRLAKETGSDFNTFVRDEKLNSPITSTTKAVFISAKIPKTMIESKLKFNCVLNFNFYNIHYTIREYLKHQHNIINILANKKQKETTDVFL